MKPISDMTTDELRDLNRRVVLEIKKRRREENVEASLAARKVMDEGTGVQFTAEANPKYLRGVGGTVERLNLATALVRVDATPRARRFAGHAVRVPFAMIEVAP